MTLPISWTPLRYHAMQSAAWRTPARFVSLACGRGSGKTELARRRLVRFLPIKKPWPDPVYVYAAPTREQAKRLAWEKIKALVPTAWIIRDGVRESDLSIKTLFGSELRIVGMDNPARIEGEQLDGIVMDESSDQRPKAFDLSVRPALTHRQAWCWRIGVPKRTGPGAPEFKKFYDDSFNGLLGANHVAYSWPSWDILPADEIEEARRTLDEKDFNEQFGASWESMSGLIFHAFDELKSVDDGIKYEPEWPLIVGSDFNVSPMAWCVGQKVRGEDRINFFDELFISNTNTQHTLDALYEKYGQHQGGWMFFGDATGRARKTSAASSDYAQIANDERFVNSRILYPKANPSRADRFAACNAMLKNAAGEMRCKVHPRCKNLIKDLSTRNYVEGTREPEDASAEAGHITDAFGYVIHYIWPVVPKAEGEDNILIPNG